MNSYFRPAVIPCTVALLMFTSTAFADWKADANASIEQIRKRDWTLQVQNANGQPVVGATVEVRQRRHEFAFGSAMNLTLRAEPHYAEFFAQNFEWAVFENQTKWPDNEPVQGRVTYEKSDNFVAFCRKRGIMMRGHCVFMESTGGSYQQPVWLDALDTNQLRSAVDARLDSVVPRYAGVFQNWDVVNELLQGNYFRGRLGNDIVAYMHQRTRALDPRVGRFVNEYGPVENTGAATYVTLITNLLASGTPIDGIGVQGHFFEGIIDPPTLKGRLDTLGSLGLPIWITEYDSRNTDATILADNLEKLYRVAFSQTNVQGILMWGFWAQSHWLGANAAIVNTNWTLTLAGQRYTNLMSEWTTVTNGVTDAQGNFSLRGFLGDYDVKLSASGQTTVTQAVVLAKGAGIQTDQVAFGPTPAPLIAADFGFANAATLKWGRFADARSCLVESSTNLSNWEIISPRLDSLATTWTVALTNGAPRRFFRARSDPLPPPDFDFYEATGGKRTDTINASGLGLQTETGMLHRAYNFYAASDLRNGVLSLTEDPAEPSPTGGPPGVFRFSMDTKPTTVGQSFWGFILKAGSVPEWPSSGVTTSNLSKTRLRFYYKLTAGRTISVNLQPISGGFNERCDFGTFTGNGQWQGFSRLLSTGSNGTAFLDFLNTRGERYLNLVFGNGAALDTYANGDTLLMDDISLYFEP